MFTQNQTPETATISLLIPFEASELKRQETTALEIQFCKKELFFVDMRYDSLVAKTEKSLLHMHHPRVEILDKSPIIQSKQYTMEN